MSTEKARLKVKRPRVKTERIGLRLDPETRRRVEQAASAERRPITNFIEAAIAEALERRGV